MKPQIVSESKHHPARRLPHSLARRIRQGRKQKRRGKLYGRYCAAGHKNRFHGRRA